MTICATHSSIFNLVGVVMERKMKICLFIAIIISLLMIGFLMNYVKESEDTEINVSYSEKLQINTEVHFEVGKEFRYESIETIDGKRYANRLSTYTIESIEEIDKKTCYVLHLKWNATIYQPSEYNMEVENIIYHEINTGEIIKVILNTDEPLSAQTVIFGKEAERELIETNDLLFAPWMLNLIDKFTYEGLYIARVIGKERINGESTFKIEIVSSDRTIYMWISIEKSIPLKQEFHIENIIAVKKLTL